MHLFLLLLVRWNFRGFSATQIFADQYKREEICVDLRCISICVDSI
jgi:hypothetical protein